MWCTGRDLGLHERSTAGLDVLNHVTLHPRTGRDRSWPLKEGPRARHRRYCRSDELVIVTSCGMHDRRACDGPSGCYGARALSTVNKYLTDYPSVSVVTVDGNDLYGSCPDPYPRLQAQLARRIALHFVREVDADRKVTARWVRPPDLSARGSISELA